MSVLFQNRMGQTKELKYFHGETLESVLLRNRIPVTSVISTLDDSPITESTLINDEKDYIVRLIEGYDIDTIITDVFNDEETNTAYIKNRVSFNIDGSLFTEHIPMNTSDVSELVESNIEFAISNYSLISPGETVLVGLSGGVDSSSLLIALSKLSKKMNFKVVAATFKDFDSLSSPAFANAQKLANSLSIEHKLIDSEIIEKVFNLNRPLRTILPAMMETEFNYFAMYADHHTTRRALEVFADEIKVDKIILGLHTSDLVAGLLNSYTMGYQMASIFQRQVGKYTYVYPLMFVPKKELHIYYYHHQKKYAVHSYPNMWELNPKDRNYYYYLADQLQYLFPGIENYLFEANTWSLKRQKPLEFTICGNCGAAILQQESAPVNDDLCDVCRMFKKLGYTEERTNDN